MSNCSQESRFTEQKEILSPITEDEQDREQTKFSTNQTKTINETNLI